MDNDDFFIGCLIGLLLRLIFSKVGLTIIAIILLVNLIGNLQLDAILQQIIDFFDGDQPPISSTCKYTAEPRIVGDLTVGEEAFVLNTNQGLACRVCPGNQDTTPKLWLDNDLIVDIADGPVSTNQDNWLWWNVSLSSQETCWAADGDGNVRWLLPLEWYTGELDAIDLGGWPWNREYFVVSNELHDDMAVGARIFYNDEQVNFTRWGPLEDMARWGVPTRWDVTHPLWRDDSRWRIEFRYNNDE